MRVSNYMVAVSAAALLLAGSAFAQSPGADKNMNGGAAAQKSESASPSKNKGSSSEMGKGSSEMNKSSSPKGTVGQAAPESKGADTNRMSQDKDSKSPSGMSKNATENARPGSSDRNAAETKSGTQTNPSTAQTKSGTSTNSAAETKSGTSTNSTAQTTTKSGATVGSTGDQVNLTTQQKSEIRSKVLVSGAPRVDHVDFSVNVGTVVPSSVRVVEVPETLITIHPAWRGYRYFVYNDEIIIVEPSSLRIVAILNV